jgi:hypothetical protein
MHHLSKRDIKILYTNYLTTCVILNKYKSRNKMQLSNGPLSFGPSQHWDELFLIDASNFMNNQMKVYKITCPKDQFQNIKVNKNQTFLNQCNEKRRPRLSLKDILTQLNNKYEKIYDGIITCLLE